MKWNRCRLFSAWVPCLSRWKQEDRERNRELTDTLTRYLTQFSQAYEVQVYTENENQLQRYDHRYILNITGQDTVKRVLRDHYIEKHVSWHILYWQKVINSMILNESSQHRFYCIYTTPRKYTILLTITQRPVLKWNKSQIKKKKKQTKKKNHCEQFLKHRFISMGYITIK